MSIPVDDYHEWLEADGLGGFASGTICGLRTRRHQALLLVATEPPGRRVVLVNGFDAWVDTPHGQYAISGQRYSPDVAYPDGPLRLEWFAPEPWPQWRFRLTDGTRVHQELFVCSGTPAVAVAWHLDEPRTGVRLLLRPFLSGRECGAVQVENADLDATAEIAGQRIVWRPYAGVPAVVSIANAEYVSDPTWYRNFLYREEHARGLDGTEDLSSPGVLSWDLSAGEAAWVLTIDGAHGIPDGDGTDARALLDGWRRTERARRQFPSRLHRAADAYVVRRGSGKTIVAGYPWLLDCARDTFIALRGLCLSTGRFDDARAILLTWAATVADGMIPDRFPDNGQPPRFSVDASLWFVIAVHELIATAAAHGAPVPPHEQAELDAAIDAILTRYAAGTRHGIRCDADGLLAAGEPGTCLTWMDAMIGDTAVTPRIGKPIEVEALWLNALWVGSQRAERWTGLLGRGREAFAERFWNAQRGCLFDVIDCEHRAGTSDPALRPNQIFAVGGLPLALLEDERARQVVEVVEQYLWTPLGLRSLAQDEAGYVGTCCGDALRRHAAYHQGTVWPWLIGPFVEAWLRVHGASAEARRAARDRYLVPLLDALDRTGLGHICQIADGDPLYTSRGCPFQAWSVGEALRIQHLLL